MELNYLPIQLASVRFLSSSFLKEAYNDAAYMFASQQWAMICQTFFGYPWFLIFRNNIGIQDLQTETLKF